MAEQKAGPQYLKPILLTKATNYKVIVSCGEPEKQQNYCSSQPILFLLALPNVK